MTTPRVEARERLLWEPKHRARMEELIDEYDISGGVVPWRDHLHELGHRPLSSVRTMASHIRARRLKARERATNRMLRNIADASIDYKPTKQRELDSARRKRAPAQEEVAAEAPKPVDLADYMRCTSTQRMSVMADIQARIATHGTITGGMLGDPLPGRSALDEKRGTAIEAVTHSRLRQGRATRIPTTATRLDRDLR